jgi:hypothetical protein
MGPVGGGLILSSTEVMIANKDQEISLLSATPKLTPQIVFQAICS